MIASLPLSLTLSGRRYLGTLSWGRCVQGVARTSERFLLSSHGVLSRGTLTRNGFSFHSDVCQQPACHRPWFGRMAFGCEHTRCSLWCDHMKQRTAIHILRDCQPTSFSRPVRTPVSRELAFRRDVRSLTPSCKVLGMRAHVCVCACMLQLDLGCLRKFRVAMQYSLSAYYVIPGYGSVCQHATKSPGAVRSVTAL